MPTLSLIPYFVTIFLAIFVARSISLLAPVDISSNTNFSDTLPPNSETIFSIISVLDIKDLSSVGLYIVYPPAIPLGIIDIWWTGSCVGKNLLTTACPASWYATNFCSFSLLTLVLFSGPIVTLTIASSTSVILISGLFLLAANKAASFNTFSKSAPENPDVFFAIVFKSTSGANFFFLLWTSKISSLALTSGADTTICLSNLPGLNKALSNTSGLLVAANTITPSLAENPSISTNNWFSVCSLSSCPPPSPAPLWRPTASISSINTIHGAFFFASSNKSLSLEAPTPTNISTKSEPLIMKNGTPASPATAFAKSVFPVPGCPTNKTPFGILAPISANFLGFFKNSTISSNSSFSSSTPATSLNVTFVLSVGFNILALLFPKDIVLFEPAPPCAPLFINKNQNIKNIINIPNGVKRLSIVTNKDSDFSVTFIVPVFILSSNADIRCSTLGIFTSLVTFWFFNFTFAFTLSAEISISFTSPASTLESNSE